jgi:ketosteroid isomerase-like protein
MRGGIERMTDSFSPRGVVDRFLGAMNRGDIESIHDLMSDDHLFTDSEAKTIRGRERMKAGWTGYLGCCGCGQVSGQS